MFWDDLVRRVRRESRTLDPKVLRAAGGHVAVLPGPRRARRSRALLIALIALAVLALALLFGTGRIGSATSTAPAPSGLVEAAGQLG